MIDGADVFLDTNILLYAARPLPDELAKWNVARGIVAQSQFCTSAQVLAEFYVNARKGRQGLSPQKAADWVRWLNNKPCQAVDARVVEAGIAHSQRYQLSYWDGAIIAAAERIGAKTVYSEDLNHGQTYGGVQVINPFLDQQ